MTGLIDGVGSFTYSRSGKQLALYFAVKISGSAPLLDDLKAFFRAGAIYSIKGSSYFRIQRRDELGVVLDHFDRYPLRAKQHVYEVWRAMVVAKAAFRKPDRERLEVLAHQLSTLTR